jgi:1-acyl-sn-glycerol-3-phosphate acyltransferase
MGAENIDRKKAYVVVCNHQSSLDVLAVMQVQLCFLPRNTKGGSITVPLTSFLTGLESAAWQLTIFVFIGETD